MSEPSIHSSALAALPGGVFAASLTPFDNRYKINRAQLLEHVKWLLSHGCNGVALFGTTGEANSLSAAERMASLNALVEGGISPQRLLVGTGCCAIDDTATLTRHAIQHQVGGVLVLPPFYYKNPSDEGLFAAYDQVIQQVGEAGLSVYLYHIPPVSQVPLSHALIERLLERYPETIAGIKDSGGDFEHMKSIRQAFPRLRLFAGTERYLLDVLRIGGVGCVSASANVSCGLAAQVYEAWRRQAADVEELQNKLTGVRHMLEPFPMIAALKFLVAERTGIPGWCAVYPPLTPLEVDQRASLFEVTGGALTW